MRPTVAVKSSIKGGLCFRAVFALAKSENRTDGWRDGGMDGGMGWMDRILF